MGLTTLYLVNQALLMKDIKGANILDTVVEF